MQHPSCQKLGVLSYLMLKEMHASGVIPVLLLDKLPELLMFSSIAEKTLGLSAFITGLRCLGEHPAPNFPFLQGWENC